ncbi:MAG: PilZ domain-containing protein [Pseudomonadota bacterium]
MIMNQIDDRRSTVTNLPDGVADRRTGRGTRRMHPRWRTLKGGQIVWATGGPIKCIIRNLSEGGACLEVHAPVPHNTFDLIFDSDNSRYQCKVVWRQPPRMGVQFQ